MQPQDTTTLRGVVHELNAELVPSRFEKAQQAESGGVQLAFRTLKQRLWLTLNWQADCPRFHAIEPPPRLGERLHILPGYGDSTTVLHNHFIAAREGRVEQVWPLGARGALS